MQSMYPMDNSAMYGGAPFESSYGGHQFSGPQGGGNARGVPGSFYPGPQQPVQPGFDPIRELSPLEYPPAARVGRGRFKHLYSGAGVFSTSARQNVQYQEGGYDSSPMMGNHHPGGGSQGYGGPGGSYGAPAPAPYAGYGGAPGYGGGGGYGGGRGGGGGRGRGGFDGGYGAPGPAYGYGHVPGPSGYGGGGGGGHHHHHGQGGGGGGGGRSDGGPPRIMSRWKTKLCSFYMDSNGQFCPHGQGCQFAHGYDELRLPGAHGMPSVPAPPSIIAQLKASGGAAKSGGGTMGPGEGPLGPHGHMTTTTTTTGYGLQQHHHHNGEAGFASGGSSPHNSPTAQGATVITSLAGIGGEPAGRSPTVTAAAAQWESMGKAHGPGLGISSSSSTGIDSVSTTLAGMMGSLSIGTAQHQQAVGAAGGPQ